MMRKAVFFRWGQLVATVWLTAMFLTNLGCQSSARITGHVIDGFGQPLAGVNVTITGTSLAATSDSKGQYAVGYVPGSLEVNYAKGGYTSHSIGLQLADKSEFPAETVKLYRIPESAGIYLLGNSDYIRLGSGMLSISSQRPTVNFADPNFEMKMLEEQVQTDSYQLTGNFIPVPANAEITLVQSQVKSNIFLLRLMDERTLIKRLYYAPSTLRDQATAIADRVEPVASELQLRHVTLPPGKYAFVTPTSSDIQPNLGKRRINEGFVRSDPLIQPLYLLQATSSGAAEKAPQTATEVNRELPAQPGAYHFQGSIAGKYPIQMMLNKNGQTLSGYYFYEKYKTHISLKGSINAQGDVQLEEFAESGKVTGRFMIRFDTAEEPKRFTGTWSKPNGAAQSTAEASIK